MKISFLKWIEKKAFYILLICLLLIVIPNVLAIDEYKPYLHKAEVPEHPKVKMYGAYSTNIFPGAATYSYPIEVPKGTNNLQPSLSISYNSQMMKQRPGLLGAGWSITENYIYRDINHSLDNTSNDGFKLVFGGAHDLIYDANDILYHTETESYLKIQNFSTYWLVTDKQGTEYRFGYNNDSRLGSNRGQSYSLRWSLDQVEDVHGNKIYYSYIEDINASDLGTVYLSNISYNNDKKRLIEFAYETRKDIRQVYEQGNEVKYVKRLARINVSVDSNLIRNYRFGYESLNTADTLVPLVNISYYGDSNSILHTVSFNYYESAAGYEKDSTSWIPPVIFSDGSHVDYGVRLVDLNNDGFIDIVKAKSNVSVKKVWLNDKVSNWTETSLWELPNYIVEYANNWDAGMRFVDFDNDGFTDLLQGTQVGSNTLKAWRNNGTGWVDVSGTMAPPIYFTNAGGVDEGVRLMDFNGDGYTDIVRAFHYEGQTIKKAYRNDQGTGWTNVSTSWVMPTEFIIDGTVDKGSRVVDFNADGLPDVLEAHDRGSQIKKTWINNGTGWELFSESSPPTYFTTSAKLDNGVRFADINNDGLIDMVEDFANGTETSRNAWLGNGQGFTTASDWKSPDPFTQHGYNVGRRIADVDGDGFGDMIVAHNYDNGTIHRYTWTKNFTLPYLLDVITTEYGGKVNITYQDSTGLNNNGTDELSDIGFNVYVVKNVERNNSISGSLGVVSNVNFSFFGGSYDSLDREFRGFSRVNETRADNSVAVHYFYQDAVLKGKEYKTEVFDSDGSLYSKEEKAYRYVTNNSYHKVYVDSVSSYVYDGTATNPKITNVSYTYNDYSDVTEKYYHGDLDVTGDEKWEQYVYWYNTTNWILGKVRRYTLEDNSSGVSKITWYNYDDSGNPQDKGGLTQVEKLLTSGSNPITRYEYDDYGNLVKETDALGRETRHFYGTRDSTYTYKDRVINTLGHFTDYSFDLATGNLIWEEKNHIKKSYFYDGFGRVSKEVLPYDDPSMPSVSYNYSFDGTAPEIVKISKKESLNQTSDIYYFYDGFSNLIQARSPGGDGEQVVKDIFYDNSFRVSAESIPYLAGFSTTLAVSSSYYTNYTYDCLGRVIDVNNPDGTNKSIVFDHFNVTAFDENGHKKVYMLDVYGRIINVFEYNNDPVLRNDSLFLYNTSYYYDSNDNLVSIVDALGNVFSFGFDSLGRKISMDDPDLGSWRYGYDAVGNLLSQTDNRGVVINLSYDDLNRVIRKEANTTYVNFTYDGQFFGTLTNLSSGVLTYSYTYDNRYRITNEEKDMNGTSFSTGFTYDSMDRLIEERLPNGTLDYFYNERGLIEEIPGFINSTNYNAFGNILNRTFNNNLEMEFTYNSTDGRLTDIDTSTLQDMVYTYDSVGNVKSITDAVNNRVQSMTYDFIDRLSNASINGSDYRYVYDETGNILKIIKDFNNTQRFLHSAAQAHAPSSIVDGHAGVLVHKVSQTGDGDKNRTIEFYLVNEKNESITNVNWTVEFGDGNSNSSVTSVNLSVDSWEKIKINHTYSDGGSYNITVRASHTNYTDTTDDKGFKFGIKADSLELLKQNITNTTFEFKVKNDMPEDSYAINWSCDTGLDSETPFNLTGNETIFIIIASNYSTPGEKTLNCNASSSDGYDSKALSFTIKDIEISDYNSTIVSGNKRKINIMFRNYFTAQSVDWTVNSDQVCSGSETVGTNNYSHVSCQVNFTYPGLKLIDANISSAYTVANVSEYLVVKGLEIEAYSLVNKTLTDRVFLYTVKNYWDNTTVNWTLSDPSLVSEVSVNLSYNSTLLVVIEENYTTSGTKDVNFTVFNGSMSVSFVDRFIMSMIEIISNSMLYGQKALSISEIVVANNLDTLTMGWRFNTGEANITSEETFSLNASDKMFIIVANDYTASGVYTTSAFVNSSAYNGTLVGAVVAQ